MQRRDIARRDAEALAFEAGEYDGFGLRRGWAFQDRQCRIAPAG